MPVYSETDVANRALSKLGDVRITDISQDDTKAARAMNARLASLRDLLLSAYPWRFAMEQASLAADATAPLWGYSLRYLFPSDCLRLITVGHYSIDVEAYGVQFRVGGESTYPADAPFEVFGRYIHTDIAAPLRVLYVKRVTDAGQFPDLFAEALACQMAFDACEELTQSGSKKDDIARELKEVMTLAHRVDALQRPPGRRAPGRWMQSRMD